MSRWNTILIYQGECPFKNTISFSLSKYFTWAWRSRPHFLDKWFPISTDLITLLCQHINYSPWTEKEFIHVNLVDLSQQVSFGHQLRLIITTKSQLWPAIYIIAPWVINLFSESCLFCLPDLSSERFGQKSFSRINCPTFVYNNWISDFQSGANPLFNTNISLPSWFRTSYIDKHYHTENN